MIDSVPTNESGNVNGSHPHTVGSEGRLHLPGRFETDQRTARAVAAAWRLQHTCGHRRRRGRPANGSVFS